MAAEVTDQSYTALHDAIQDSTEHIHDGPALLTKWFIVAEWATDDGSRLFTTRSSSSCAPWDRAGLLHYAVACEEAPSDEDD